MATLIFFSSISVHSTLTFGVRHFCPVQIFSKLLTVVITEPLLRVQVFWHVTPCVLSQSHCWGFTSFGTWRRVFYHRAIVEGSGLLARDAVCVITEPLLKVQVFWHVTPCVLSQSHCCGFTSFATWRRVFYHRAIAEGSRLWHVTPSVLSQSHCWRFRSFGTWRRVFYYRAIAEDSGLLAREAVYVITEPLLRVQVFWHVTPCMLSQSLLRVQVFWHVKSCISRRFEKSTAYRPGLSSPYIY